MSFNADADVLLCHLAKHLVRACGVATDVLAFFIPEFKHDDLGREHNFGPVIG